MLIKKILSSNNAVVVYNKFTCQLILFISPMKFFSSSSSSVSQPVIEVVRMSKPSFTSADLKPKWHYICT